MSSSRSRRALLAITAGVVCSMPQVSLGQCDPGFELLAEWNRGQIWCTTFEDWDALVAGTVLRNPDPGKVADEARVMTWAEFGRGHIKAGTEFSANYVHHEDETWKGFVYVEGYHHGYLSETGWGDPINGIGFASDAAIEGFVFLRDVTDFEPDYDDAALVYYYSPWLESAFFYNGAAFLSDDISRVHPSCFDPLLVDLQPDHQYHMGLIFEEEADVVPAAHGAFLRLVSQGSRRDPESLRDHAYLALGMGSRSR